MKPYGDIGTRNRQRKHLELQTHLLSCNKLKDEIPTHKLASGQVKYEDMFAEVKKQKEAVVLFMKLIEPRLKLLQARDNQPPGVDLDPSQEDKQPIHLVICLFYRHCGPQCIVTV